MCLGIPAQLAEGDAGHPDLALVNMGGVSRAINMGLLDERPGPGDWVLVHMGFALSAMTEAEARDGLAALGAERDPEARLMRNAPVGASREWGPGQAHTVRSEERI
jgi:hydrogenase expression/formation protein HypC